MTPPGPDATVPQQPAGRITWRRVLLWAGIAAAVFLGVSHALGPRRTGFTAVIAGGVLLLGLVTWRLPHLRRHFHNPYARGRGPGSLNFPSQRTARLRGTGGVRLPHPLRGLRGGGGGGRRGRSAFRSPGMASGRRRGGGPGHFRLATGRSGTLRRSGAGARRAAGSSRRPGRGSGAARRLLPAFRRFRRGSGTGPRPRRRTGTGGGTRSTPRRRLSRPSTWFRRRRAGAPGGAAPRRRRFFRPRRAGTVPRGHRRRWIPRRHTRPWRHRFPRFRAWRHRRAMPFSWRAPVSPRRPGRVRRGWWHVFGTPAVRRARRAGRRMRRARIRAARQRRAANPYMRRVKWYAPWRVWGRGGGIRASFRRARIRRGHAALRRRRIPVRARIASRWGLWRARRLRYAGLLGLAGRNPLHLRLRHWASHGTWRGLPRRLNLRRWLRNRPPPKPLLGGRHRAGARTAALHRFGRTPLGRWLLRRDRRRRDRWAARQRRPSAVPVPGRAVRPGAWVPAPVAGSLSGARSGGYRVDAPGIAEEIELAGGAEFRDPQHVHDTLTDAHRIIEAVQAWMHQLSQRLPETGVHPAYAEAAAETAGQLSGIADQLQERIGGGVMRGPGG